MTSERNNVWFHVPKRLKAVRSRLICLPCAGGAATLFHHWPAGLPADIEVVAVALPGRAYRLREPAITRMEDLLEVLLEELLPILHQPYSFFGHSMGGLIAYELTRRLVEMGARTPQRLFISGRRAPHLPFPQSQLHKLPKQEFMSTLREYYAIPEVVLGNPELQELVLPPLRADLELLETWQHVPGPNLNMPIIGYAGAADKGTPVEHIEPWKELTHGPFEMNIFPGDHYFFQSQRTDLLTSLSRVLRAD